MLNVALKVPLAPLHVARLVERDDARGTRVQMLHESLDGPALACGVPPLEQDDDLPSGALDPALDLQQLHLEPGLVPLVFLPLHLVAVGIYAIAEDALGGDPTPGFPGGRSRVAGLIAVLPDNVAAHDALSRVLNGSIRYREPPARASTSPGTSSSAADHACARAA